jgi:signal transduction histidine kinase
MSAKNHSIRKRLLLWVSLPILATSFLIIFLALYFSWHEIEEVYDAQLVHTAKTLIQLTDHEIREGQNLNIAIGDEHPNLQHRYENKTAFRIWHGEKLIFQSAKARDFAGTDAPPGFSSQTIDGKPWRFFLFIDPAKDLRIETSERYAIRYEMISQLMLSLIVPMSILIPSLLVIVWIGIRKSLKPLIALSAAVDIRDTEDLSAIETKDVPAEAMPLVQALNRLFTRISDSFRREREFTDHAAHELRTPLAAMKTQTQVLMKKADSMPECREGLQNLNAVIDRSTHLLEQLLSMARLQNERLPLSDTNLSECVLDAVSELKTRAGEKNQRMDISVAENIHIKGHGDSLFILIRNLLDNAVKYTPDNGRITVTLTPDAMLSIADSGPGISDTDKERVFSRFVRADKSGQSGSGLGLSIAQWVANAHKASISLQDNIPQGLIVRIGFRT